MSFLHFELLWTIVDEYNHDRETKESSKLVAQRLRNGVGSSVVAIDDILCEHFANKILVNVRSISEGSRHLVSNKVTYLISTPNVSIQRLLALSVKSKFAVANSVSVLLSKARATT